MACDTDDDAVYPFAIVERDDTKIIRLSELWGAILHDLRAEVPADAIAARFHNTIAHMIVQMCDRISEETGLQQVALSGGCFQNRLLLTKATSMLREADFEILTHHQVPCNDGGVSLGQAVVANCQAAVADEV